MRIIGGFLGGRRLRAPPGGVTRPTSDRVREAIFNILGPPRPGTRVLDGFAGAGALGLEALSRGAAESWFIDRSPLALRSLRANVAALDVAGACRVFRADTLKLARRWCAPGPGTAAHNAARGEGDAAVGAAGPGRFRWIFLDPPYRTDLADRMLALLATGSLLDSDARVIVEHDRRNQPNPQYGCLVRMDCRRYGDTEVSLYRPQLL